MDIYSSKDGYSINWHQDDNRFKVKFEDYSAEIIEAKISKGNSNFTISIFDREGNPIDKDQRMSPYNSFEDANQWLLLLLTWIDLPNEQPNLIRDRLRITLDLCKNFLPKSLHPSHLERLENLETWISERSQQESSPDYFNQSPGEQIDLLFVEKNGVMETQTPFGLATIREKPIKQSKYDFGGSPNYEVEIEDLSGAILNSLGSFLTPEEAEYWLRSKLIQLKITAINETTLDLIRFTLEICKSSLPLATDILHFTRIDYLMGELEMVLP